MRAMQFLKLIKRSSGVGPLLCKRQVFAIRISVGGGKVEFKHLNTTVPSRKRLKSNFSWSGNHVMKCYLQ